MKMIVVRTTTDTYVKAVLGYIYTHNDLRIHFSSPSLAKFGLELTAQAVVRAGDENMLRCSAHPKEVMQQALCQNATRAAEKLRGERQFCRHVGIFIRTSPHALNEVFYGNSAGEKLTLPTQNTRDIIEVAMRSLDRICLDGRRYMKAGISLEDFTSNGVNQLNLFDDDRRTCKQCVTDEDAGRH